MNYIKNGDSVDWQAQVCPFLGLIDDPATALSFPSPHNRCFHAKPVQPVSLKYQGTYCLASEYTNCEEYLRKADTPLPARMRFEPNARGRTTLGKTGVWILLFVLGIAAVFTWQVLARGPLGFGILGNPMPAVSTPVIISESGSQNLPLMETQAPSTFTPTPRATSSPTPAMPTKNPMINSSHALETPIGNEHKFVIHRVQAGESLESIANHYWTTFDAIQAVNYNLPSPILEDWLIVIPVDQTDIQGLPAFEVYAVKTEIDVETLAQKTNADPVLLKLYNSLSDGEVLHAGDWVLIPHKVNTVP
jgi:hypothetical protein